MVLGIDFDNTIIKYDELFHKIAFEKGLISQELPKQKNAVRDYLRETGVEDEWTIIQGEVYGERIKEAVPFSGMLETLQKLNAKQIPINIVSHKTREPYLGPKRDLHAAALSWLKLNGIIDAEGLSVKANQVFFEVTKEAKINRIVQIGCTHYVDDLPEILEMIPDGINKILFSPNGEEIINSSWTVIRSWNDLPSVLS
jgi:hypothetical protein